MNHDHDDEDMTYELSAGVGRLRGDNGRVTK